MDQSLLIKIANEGKTWEIQKLASDKLNDLYSINVPSKILSLKAIVQYNPPEFMLYFDDHGDKGYRWEATFQEVGGISGFNLSVQDFYIKTRTNSEWTHPWHQSVLVNANGRRKVSYLFHLNDTFDPRGGIFHCVWAGKDDAGVYIRIEQNTHIPD